MKEMLCLLLLLFGGIDIDRNDQAEFEAEYWGKIAKRIEYVEEVEKQPEMQQIRKLVKQLANRGYIVEARAK